MFNRRPKVRPEQQNNSKKNAFQKKQDLMLELDEDGRPKYKVALLCGPPGLGKLLICWLMIIILSIIYNSYAYFNC